MVRESAVAESNPEAAGRSAAFQRLDESQKLRNVRQRTLDMLDGAIEP